MQLDKYSVNARLWVFSSFVFIGLILLGAFPCSTCARPCSKTATRRPSPW